jgi:hypothetical protein
MTRKAGVELLPAPPLTSGRYASPTATGTDGIVSGVAQPEAFDLWVVDAVLAREAELRWGSEHGDEAVAVLSGAVEILGEACPAGSVIALEAGAPARLRSTETSTIVHFGHAARPSEVARDVRPPAGVHVIGPGPVRGTEVPHPAGVVSAGYYLDSTCASCALTLLRTASEGAVKGSSHSHSQHELIRVVEGELRFGPLVAPAGATAAIPADVRYSFRADDRFAFLNYRAGPSTISKLHYSEPVRESADALGWGNLGARHVRIPASKNGASHGSP